MLVPGSLCIPNHLGICRGVAVDPLIAEANAAMEAIEAAAARQEREAREAQQEVRRRDSINALHSEESAGEPRLLGGGGSMGNAEAEEDGLGYDSYPPGAYSHRLGGSYVGGNIMVR
ncbi:unnamed protein product [Protopolystoma xenopodis]|uniref:Uncharacterized protein n=1 Tax=Protopolystoma xenopodis TaxID=117903 RepID=A0A448WJ86_9PLAT|nr:unnamed protein product [Protopolystoma xenopodis]